MVQKNKREIIMTFKVDETLANILRNVPNRSDFIRKSILAAIDNVCPLCMGTGILTPEQKKHFTLFLEDHELQECNKCHATYLVCSSHHEHNFKHDKLVQRGY